MKLPRSIQLSPEVGTVHKYWRCHNKEFLLSSNKNKELYMACTAYALKHKKVKDKVLLHTYCLMDNHGHKNITYHNSSNLSSFMRISHSRFGTIFNKTNNRTGKVANERPKTPLIQDDDHSLKVHMYIEANPVRANKVKLKHLKYYKYSSYRFYAYGIRDEYTKLLTIPDWYLKLGNTALKRQKEYRKLFQSYISKEIYTSEFFFENYIGTLLWKQSMKFQSISLLQDMKQPINSS